MSISLGLRTLLLAASLASAPVHAEMSGQRDFQPRTYESSSGRFALHVNPTERNAAGGAEYKLTRDGAPVWAGTRPFTLFDAVVADDGAVGGYAYTNGHDSREAGKFVVAILGPSGNTRLLDSIPRQRSHFLHTPPNPQALGLFLDSSSDRFVVRVADSDLNANVQAWWVYRMSDGRAIGKVRPRDFMADTAHLWLQDARPIPGTPLTLIHWVRTGRDLTSSGASFTLVDAKYKPVWSLTLPADYTVKGDARAQALLIDRIRTDGAILETRPAQFDIHHVADGKRVRYGVDKDPGIPGTWRVREIAKTPFAKATTAQPDRGTREPGLAFFKELAAIEIESQARKESPLPSGRISDFAIGEAGRIAVLGGCGCGKGEHGLSLVDTSGKLLREIPLNPSNDSSHVAWVGGQRWIVTTSPFGDGAKSTAVWIDGTTGSITPVRDFSAPMIESVVGSADGGFVALVADHQPFTIRHSVVAFDRTGRTRWQIREGSRDEQLFSPAGVAITTAGDVVVLEGITNKIKVYDRNGRYRRTRDLESAWKRKPNYLSDIQADSAGGVIVHDFHGQPPIVHMTIGGRVLGEFTPAYPDGRRFDIIKSVRSDPSGKMWMSDGRALLRLDSTGTVDLLIGESPNPAMLGDIAALSVTAKGWIYAVDRRTGAVHVFDKGTPHHVDRPDIGDYPGELHFASLAISDSGEVLVTRRDFSGGSPSDFLHYDSKGTRIGVESLALDQVSQTWIAQPGSSNRWVIGYTRAYLVSDRNAVLRRLDRAANGQWLDHPGPAGAAPDGSIAILSGAQRIPMGGEPTTPLVTIYSPAGDPVASWPAPRNASTSNGGIAYDGKRLAFVIRAGEDEKTTGILVTDTRGNALATLPLNLARYETSVFFVESGSGTELWLFDGKATIRRFAYN
jgi:hypothetical protein